MFPTAAAVGIDGVLVTVRLATGAAITVAEACSATMVPWGSSAVADAVLWIEPTSMSAWVARYVQVYDHASPTCSRLSPLVSPAWNTGGQRGSDTVTFDRVTLPSLATVTV